MKDGWVESMKNATQVHQNARCSDEVGRPDARGYQMTASRAGLINVHARKPRIM
jgi:hypothetical protein